MHLTKLPTTHSICHTCSEQNWFLIFLFLMIPRMIIQRIYWAICCDIFWHNSQGNTLAQSISSWINSACYVDNICKLKRLLNHGMELLQKNVKSLPLPLEVTNNNFESVRFACKYPSLPVGVVEETSKVLSVSGDINRLFVT